MKKPNIESLKQIAFYLSGLKDGKGNLLPLGTVVLEDLWDAITYMQGISEKKETTYEIDLVSNNLIIIENGLEIFSTDALRNRIVLRKTIIGDISAEHQK